MPAYIILNQFRSAGLDNIDQMQDDMTADIAAIKELGGEFQGLWLTFGRFDAVGIVDLPDDETAFKLMGHLNRNRGTATETLNAIPAERARPLLPEGI